MISMRSISLLTAVAVLAPLAGQDGVKLRWQFKAGDVLRYRMTTEQSIEMSMMPGTTMENTIGFVLHEDVKEVAADGTASLDVGYEAMRVDVDTGMGTRMSFDSTLTGDDVKANDPMLTKVAKQMLEAKLHMKLEPSGHVGEIVGMKELLAKVTDDLAPDMTGQMLKRMFSEDSLRKMVEVNVFPDKALVLGDTWKRNFEQAAPPIGTLKFAVDNKLTGQEDHGGSSCAKIAMTTKMTLGSDDSSASAMSATMDESKGEGTMWFDTKRGRMVEVEQAWDMKMSFGKKSAEGADDEHSMEMTSSVSTRLLLLGKDAPVFEHAGGKPAGAKK